MWDAGEGTGAAGGGGRADGAAGPGGQGAAGDGRETQTAAVSHTSSFFVSFSLLSFAHMRLILILMGYVFGPNFRDKCDKRGVCGRVR